MRRFGSPLGRDTEFGFLDRTASSSQVLNPVLISNDNEHKMLQAIRTELANAERFVFSVAFISSRGIALLKEALVEFQGTGEIITSNYLDFNDPKAFRELLLLDGVTTYIHEDLNRGFHAKGYIFHQREGVTAIVGSSNLTDNALLVNQEWNLKFSASHTGDIAFQLADAVDAQKAHSQQLTTAWIDEYERNRVSRPVLLPGGDSTEDYPDSGTIMPNSMQAEALESIRSLQEAGETKAVVISATGTGKTILAALAVRADMPKRLLFIVHREQILTKAMSEFQRVLEEPSANFGKLVGAQRETDKRYIFSTIQSLSRADTLAEIPRDAFDYIIIDEVHRAGAESYRRVIEHFTPDFFLGLTATPERTDGFNVFELFDFNVPYEIRLHQALEEKMLVPFHYYGVTDFVDANNETIEDIAQLERLIAKERVHYVLDMIRVYGHPTDVKGLIFCSRKDEAQELSELFNRETINGKQLRTKVLTGDDSITVREDVVQELEDGQIDYIFTVDIFNEGIDIPPVNQIVMLRGTQSSIIFTQQLGRGLRKAPGKDHLRVIDFIGNYANNYLIPVALFGNNSRNKESIRKSLLDNNSTNTIAGVSSVNFDRISKDRILNALNSAVLDNQAKFKDDIRQLFSRLGTIPRLFDFARFNTVDPVVLATRRTANYWKLLLGLKFISKGPTPQQDAVLTFLSNELLSGKRPHELLLLQALIKRGSLTPAEFQKLLETKGTTAGDATISSVERVLSLEFFTQAQQERYGNNPLIMKTAAGYQLHEEFSRLYFALGDQDSPAAETFANHVDDVIDTGLFLSRERGFWLGTLLPGATYSRKDVCRLLNWKSNQESTVYGYKYDKYTSTMPLFVTYHKDESVSESTNYGDQFLSPQVMHWFSKNNRRLDSKDLQPILTGKAAAHLLVKKDDDDGTNFYYLGTVRATDPEQQSMPNDAGESLDVVTMNLELDSPVEQALYDYLTNTRAH